MTNSDERAMSFWALPERRSDARRAQLTVFALAGALFVLAVGVLAFAPPWQTDSPILRFGAPLLAVLAVAAVIRVALVRRKSLRFVADDDHFLTLNGSGVTIARDTHVPWSAVSGVWAWDNEAARVKTQGWSPVALSHRLMLRAGVNTVRLFIGIADTREVADPRGLVVHGKNHRGRIDIPFGSWVEPQHLGMFLNFCESILGNTVPVRQLSKPFEFGTATVYALEEDRDELRERYVDAAAP